MSGDPLRRVLFPTPPRNDDATPTRSIHTIRPKAEITPVNLDSTPTFRQLVENSPVPLAVAAATAAMRAAESAQTGQPVITDMTRAAEEVVKNGDCNSIRPPLPSPRSLSSPRFSAVRASQSVSASLPPRPIPTGGSRSAIGTFLSKFMRPLTPMRASVPPATGKATNQPASDDINQPRDLSNTRRKPKEAHGIQLQTNSFRQPNFMSSSPEKLSGEQEVAPTKRPFQLVKPDALRRMFASASPVSRKDYVAGHIGYHDHPERTGLKSDEKLNPRSKEYESNDREGNPERLSKTTLKMDKSRHLENAPMRMQTRSHKRVKSDGKKMMKRELKSEQPKKRRRMSEVLRLQKALESAAWTDSVAVQDQTEVIVISDDSPVRSRPDLSSATFETNAAQTHERVRESWTKIARKSVVIKKKFSVKKAVRSKPEPLVQKASKVGNLRKGGKSYGKSEVTTTVRKRLFEKSPNVEVVHDDEKRASRHQKRDSLRKKRLKKEIRPGEKSLAYPNQAVTSQDKQVPNRKPPGKAKTISENLSPSSSTETPVPLKKRISPEQRRREPVLRSKKADTSKSGSDKRTERSSRKRRNPKRLDPPASGEGAKLKPATEDSANPIRKGCHEDKT